MAENNGWPSLPGDLPARVSEAAQAPPAPIHGGATSGAPVPPADIPNPGVSDKSGGLNPESKTFSIRCSAVEVRPILRIIAIFDKATDNQYITKKDAFEWDDDKAAANWRAHGVAFHQAVKAFRDPFGVERIDDRDNYGEERINLLGMCEGVILHVTYTERGTHTADLGPAGGKT